MAAADDWMEGIEFPATKHELIEAADDADAPQEVIEQLQALAREQYESRAELDGELGRDA